MLKCVFLGYKSDSKGYIVLDFDGGHVLVSKDVSFYESHFSYKRNQAYVEENSVENNFNFLTLFLIKIV